MKIFDQFQYWDFEKKKFEFLLHEHIFGQILASKTIINVIVFLAREDKMGQEVHIFSVRLRSPVRETRLFGKKRDFWREISLFWKSTPSGKRLFWQKVFLFFFWNSTPSGKEQGYIRRETFRKDSFFQKSLPLPGKEF